MRHFPPEELIKCDMLHDPVSAILEGTGMLIRCASPALRFYLGCFWALVGEAPASVETLPDGCAQFTVELNRSAEPRVFLSGPRDGPGHYAKPAGTRVIGVRLRPGVAYLLRPKPMCELVNRRVPYPAPDLVGPMRRADSINACFDTLELYLSGRLAGSSLDLRVSAAVHAIGKSAGAARIDEVARCCGVSCRHLERLMRVWVGVSPKRLARVARFQFLLSNLADGSPKDWTRMAAESYADQSHLIHEFAEFAGASPQRFYAGQSTGAAAARCGNMEPG
jgi:AraC-like DNA-binding protein